MKFLKRTHQQVEEKKVKIAQRKNKECESKVYQKRRVRQNEIKIRKLCSPSNQYKMHQYSNNSKNYVESDEYYLMHQFFNEISEQTNKKQCLII
ncbi:unnamed protein product [Paramecium octaurelia]|uniref:Uncharacterized protein n=1 Tax=Paramecium octaurelia TaxID=43137 RepID=A0A8S1W0S4_PAROT|nr:unnamed protein product [Paramecium octaurelia]